MKRTTLSQQKARRITISSVREQFKSTTAGRGGLPGGSALFAYLLIFLFSALACLSHLCLRLYG
ncbi:hypothetical protein RRG08_027134 [Elysia crispata]|uniref:Uncharacterized protein n=1 Tax=Elysia crispata TaxID=231223 RepID=A0AAE0YVB8_9GAST|nr:hypothetical protein RRG08_027134 [Elysia crispata]